ncbi:mitochondrial Rho GTPase 1-A isoform X1 [Aplysia californica]|uniref:Mitochondrial Rho GTPase n=1 Tax=Aplysia californica TaxID=6500 RepID=A0ABM0JVC0_APLCA|nr:mitochondrial Rho GTPase 1-A isoform X1 [Aplysia californica]
MTSYKRDVRILLVGDEKVGKTSLILSLVSEEFAEEVPARAEEITIPADVTPEHVPTCIVDYSAQDQDESLLQDEIRKASVVCIVYSVIDEDSIQRLTTYWLPFLRHTLGEDHRTPVILVGNKVDMTDIQTLESILPIMNDFGEVETCVECSARTLKNISEVFYYAQKAVLHPTAPVYNPDEKELTHPAKRALTRIFRICDLDNDNLLSDDEINMFQLKCFNAPLHPQALEDVKSIVKKNVCDGIIKDGITLKGFLFLHTLFIQKGRHETTWTVLRKFGYDDNLQLTTEYIAPQLTVSLGCTTEMTAQGYTFLARLFDKYDEDRDGCLSPTELQSLFSTCPMMPWGPDVNNTVCTNADGWVTMEGYLAQWTLTTLLDVTRAIEFLAYLGYNYQHDSQLSAIHVTREKKIDLEKRQTGRNVFRCHVLGAKSVGKTAFLQGLLNRNLRYVATLNRQYLSNFTINTVQVYGQDKYLMLHEVDMMMCDMLTPTELDCDVACLVYDVTNPQSFEFCARMYLKHFIDSKIPTLIVASKAEYPEVRQDYEFTPAQFCSRFKLPPPQRFTCIDKVNHDVYVKLATMAAYPNLKRLVHMLLVHQRPLWLEERLRHMRGLFQKGGRPYVQASVGVAVAALLGFALYKVVSSSSSSSSIRR